MSACRICYEEGEDLLSPCACTGSIQYAHKRCLRKWLLVAGRSHCELCKTPYRLALPTLEPAYEPHFIVVRLSTRSYMLFLIQMLSYLLYLLTQHTEPRHLSLYPIEYEILGSMLHVIPCMLLGLFVIQAAVFGPAIYALHDKGRYMRYLCSFTHRLPGMRSTPGLFLTIMMGGFAASFYFPVGGAAVCLFFMTKLYPLHGLLITTINMDGLIHDLE